MCGGYQLMLDTDAIAALNGGAKWRTGHGEGHSPRPSVRPTNFAPVLVRSDAKGSDGKANASGHSVEVALMKWGLVPRWTKADAPEKPPLINARRETIKDLPSFAGSLPRRRCVVVSTGFFEWEKGPTKSSKKTPFLINMGTPAAIQNVLFFAGVYDTWVSPDGGEPLYSFTICTTHASEQFAWLHHRLPCILPTAKDVADWLNVDGISGPDAADALLKTLPSGLVWRQMSQDLDRAVAAPRSRHVKPDVKKYFSAGPSEAKKPLAFPMSFAERVGYSQIPPLNKLDSLDSPIKKKASRKTASGSKISPKVANKSKTPNAKGLGASPKKEEKPGQRKITSFFTKKE